MKTLLTIAATLLLSITSIVSEAREIVITISFDLARPKNDCMSGFWFCNVRTKVETSSARSAKATYNTDNGELTISFNESLSADAVRQGYFFAERGEEVVLPADFCRKIGATVRMIPGKYVINLSDGTHGSVTVQTEHVD